MCNKGESVYKVLEKQRIDKQRMSSSSSLRGSNKKSKVVLDTDSNEGAEELSVRSASALLTTAMPATGTQQEIIQHPENVSLNVGGTMFNTTVGVLTTFPNTYFSVLFSGRWDVRSPETTIVIKNRCPIAFDQILHYLRGDLTVLNDLSEAELAKLAIEADFYGFGQLAAWCRPPPTGPRCFHATSGTVRLSEDHKVGTKTDTYPSFKYDSFALGVEMFIPRPGDPPNEQSVQLMGTGKRIAVSLGPRELLQGLDWAAVYEYGWHFFPVTGVVLGKGLPWKEYGEKSMDKDSIITVRLESNGDLSFAVNGKNGGVAHTITPPQMSSRLYLTVMLAMKDTSVSCV